MELEKIILGEVAQPQNDKYGMCSLVSGDSPLDTLTNTIHITKLQFIDSGKLGKEEGTDAGMSLGGENRMDFTGRLGSEGGGSQSVLQRDWEEGEMSKIGRAFVGRYENLVQCKLPGMRS